MDNTTLEAQCRARTTLTFVERCIRDAYNPGYLQEVLFQTYRVLYNSFEQAGNEPNETIRNREQVREEYERSLTKLPFPQERWFRSKEILPYEGGLALGNWSRDINQAYTEFARATVAETGIDPLYDPRSVFDNLKRYLDASNTKLPWLVKIMDVLNRHGSKFLDNNLLEVDDLTKKQRVTQWQSTLPAELSGVCSEGDLSDVMHLGSKAMADAFSTYFSHHCLSGSLGEASITPGVFTASDEVDYLTVDHLYSFVRISQRVLAGHLLRRARESEFTTADPELWIQALIELEESKKKVDHDNTIERKIRPTLDFLHKEMTTYIEQLADIDLSVLKPVEEGGCTPFVTQLDSVYLLRTEKHNGSRDRAIFADEMGSGKTFEAIFADALYRQEGAVTKTLIICPNQMKDEWRKRFSKYLSEETIAQYYSAADGTSLIKVINGSASMQGMNESSVVIVNYEMVHRSLRYVEQEEETILELAEQALLNGVEDLFKEDDTLQRVRELGEKARTKQNTVEECQNAFRDKEKISTWIGNDQTRAAYALAADEFLRKEKRLTESLFSYSTDFLIMDEAHAIKNPNAKRTKGIQELVKEIPRVALLTGTLIPNRYDDITIPLQIVDTDYDPEDIGDNETTVTLAPKLRRIRQALIPYLSRNKRQDISPRTYRVTPEEERISAVAADDVMVVVYRAIIEDHQLTFAEKTRLARLATLNPALAINKLWEMAERENSWIDADGIIESMMDKLPQERWGSLIDGSYVPPKYQKVAELMGDNSDKVVIFTSHIEGNTRTLDTPHLQAKTLIEYLQEKFPQRKILLHDGRTPNNVGDRESERGEILRQFNDEDDTDLVASYPTLGEGSDLTPAKRVICLDLPYALPEQGVGRVDRITQTRDVSVFYLTAIDEKLSAGTKSELTIDQAILALGRDKLMVSSILLDGKPPGEEELEAYRKLLQQNGEKPHAYTPLRDGLELKDQQKEEKERLRTFITRVASNTRGSRRNVRDFDDRLRQAYIDLVLDKTSYTHKSNQMIAQIIGTAMEGRQLVDIGGGPASLALCGEIVTPYEIVDPTPWEPSLESVLRELDLPFPRHVRFHQNYWADFAREKEVHYDAAVCNNMLHWTSPRAHDGSFSERELALRLINTCLPENGLFVLGLPGTYSDLARENIELFLDHTGFQEYTIGQVRSPDDQLFTQFVAVARKTGLPSETPLSSAQLNLKFSGGRTTKKIGTGRGKRDKKKNEAVEASIFIFDDHDVRGMLR